MTLSNIFPSKHGTSYDPSTVPVKQKKKNNNNKKKNKKPTIIHI